MSSTSPQKPSHLPPAGDSLVLSDAAQLLSSFADFLIIALHSLLYHRGLYPATTFLTARAYNLPVQQSRHPGLCAWIRDAVAAVVAQLQRGCVDRVVVVFHAPESLAVVERWVFDVSTFPEWGHPDAAADAEAEDGEEAADEEALVDDVAEADADGSVDAVNWVDVNEALRGALRRIAYAGESLPNPPKGSTFTLAVELREDGPAPITHPQPWIPSPYNPHHRSKARSRVGSALQTATTTPVRSVRAGPLFFECWIEQPSSVSQESQTSGRSHNTVTS